MDKEYQTFPRALYVITSGDNETEIKDGTSNKVIGKLPANAQGIIYTLSKSIKTDNPVSLNLLK